MSRTKIPYYCWLFLATFITLFFNTSSFAQQAAKATQNYQIHTTQQQINSSITEDKTLVDLIAPYSANVKREMDTVIGRAPNTINKEGPGAGHLGMLITDIIRQQATKVSGKKIDIAFQNNGGLRAEIPAGEITIGTIYRLMPFDNEIAVIELSGTDLMELFESMGASIKDFGAAVSGVQLVYKEKSLVSAKIDDQSVDPKATYTLALTDYLYKGGGEYPILRRGKNYQTFGLLLRDAIINYIKTEQTENHPITVSSSPRISLVNAANN
jgi:2',3'-cyclic-nucleotide 2'-phosphodiesterase (5'-nucleotidase family)